MAQSEEQLLKLKNKEYKYPNRVEVEDLLDVYDLDDDEHLELLLNDFPHFLAYTYYHIGLMKPSLVQNRIANIFDYYEKEMDGMILESLRGVGKSWIAVIYLAWTGLRDVDNKHLCTSATESKAGANSGFLKKLFVTLPILRHLDPSQTDKDGVKVFNLLGALPSIEASYSTVPIFGQLTGKRATRILADDVEIIDNSATEEARQKLVQKCEEMENLLIPDKPAKILFLGTPQSMETIYNKFNYFKIIIPSEVPAKSELGVYDGWIDEWVMLQGEKGDAVDKERFGTDVLERRKSKMSKAMYKLQYMLDTTLSDADKYPLKQSDLIITPLNSFEVPAILSYSKAKTTKLDIQNLGFTGDTLHSPFKVGEDNFPYDMKALFIDVSGKGGDETAWAVIGVLSGRLHVIEWGGMTDGYSDETLMTLAMKAKEHEVQEIVPEANYGDGMFAKLLAPIVRTIYPCTIVEDYKVSGRKEDRIINNLAPLTQQHKLVLDEACLMEEVEWVAKDPKENLQYSFIYQMTHVEAGVKDSTPHDDRLDVVAMGAEYFKEYVGVSPEDTLKRLEEEEMLDWLEEKIYGKQTRKSASPLRNSNTDLYR